MRRLLSITMMFVALPSICVAEMKTETLRYEVDGETMSSVLVYDDASPTKRAGIVMVPNWMGVNDAQIAKAKTIAGTDYVVLVADVYGEKTRPTNSDEASKAAMAAYADRKVLRARARAAIDQLRESADESPLDVSKLAAIGFCFGGATALELGRDGADLAGVVSFHGNLATDIPAAAGAIKAKILVLNGADDTYVPAEQINGFSQEMQKAGADWQFVNLGGAVHCFAEPDQNNGPGCVYNERAAKRAFTMMRNFLDEAFSSR
jgi:dienelactone hydrolase